MKPKRIKRIMRQAAQAAFDNNLRAIWYKLCILSRRERWRLAWMLVRGDDDLDKAAGRKSQ